MRRLALSAAIIVVLGIGVVAQPQKPVGTGGSGSSEALAVTPNEMNWGAAPDSLPSGAQLAVLSGDPTGSGPFAVRLKMPDGYKIAPHWHPTDENITVLEGTLQVGMGDQFSESALKTLSTGSYGKMPQHMNHYATAKGATTIQIEGQGPFQVNYVNSSDDPRNKK